MPGFIPLPDLVAPRNRMRRGFCADCGKASVVKLETGLKVCTSCGGYWEPEAPTKPSAEQVFALYLNGQRPSAQAVRAALDMNIVRFAQLVHGYLDDGSADRVNPELAESLRRERDRLRSLRTVGA